MTLVQKNPKITDFINLVVNPAISAVQYHKDNIDTGASFGTDFSSDVVSITNQGVTPFSFTEVPALGGMMTASQLAAIFQIYAWHLTSIRRAQLYRLNSMHGTITGYTLLSDGITSLSKSYAMPVATFNSQVSAAPNPLTALQPASTSTEAALDALIARLASVCANHRPNNVALYICHGSCHSSCHGSCHGSRGRR